MQYEAQTGLTVFINTIFWGGHNLGPHKEYPKFMKVWDYFLFTLLSDRDHTPPLHWTHMKIKGMGRVKVP